MSRMQQSLVLGLLQQLVVALLLADISVAQNYCGNAVYNNSAGTIYSPGFYYGGYSALTNCTYNIRALRISRISLTFQTLDLEYQSSCNYDWVQVGCASNRVELPRRICGHSAPIDAIVFSLCSDVRIDFESDGSVQGTGFSIHYEVHEIECVGNCTPVSNSYGYVCPCDTNGTNATLPTTPTPPSCPFRCTLFSDHRFCICPELTRTTTLSCPPGCHPVTNDYDYETCDCTHTTTPSPATCAPGCYRTTDYRGYPYCNCPSTTNPPLTCPYGCHADADYFGNRYCNCPASTQPPILCSPGCTSAVDASGSRYCNCPTTTLPPCDSPCYILYDRSQSYSGVAYCFCPTTTTGPPPTGCNQTLTATSGIVTSPNYPNEYPTGIDCVQQILVPMATSIKLRLIDLNVYYSSTYSCGYEYIVITGCDNSESIYCTTYNFPTTGLVFQCTDSSLVTISFHSYSSSYYYYYNYRGFKLMYSANFGSNCSDSGVYLSNGEMGYLTSPNFPSNFPSYSECFTYIYSDDDVKIRITFEQLSLDDTSTCEKVSLTLTCQDDSSNGGTNPYKEICGSRIPPPITFDCRVLQIWFRSNTTRAISQRGYKMMYKGIPKQLTTTSTSTPLMPRIENGNGLSESSRLGVGLGVGVGGFFLLILIAIIIVLIIGNHRRVARREDRQLEALAVICRNMDGNRPDAGGRLQIWNNAEYGGGHVNPIHEGQQHSSEHLPTYECAAGGFAEASSVGGDFSTEKPKAKLLD